MKTTIENNRTVIRKPFDIGWVKEQLEIGVPITVEYLEPHLERDNVCRAMLHEYNDGNQNFPLRAFHHGFNDGFHLGMVQDIITILPPLPKHPKPEDARLLYLYAAHGIEVVGEGTIDISRTQLNHLSTMEIEQLKDVTITHAINAEIGERVEVAIKE